MISKNIYWWIVAVLALVASVLNAIVDQWFVCGFMVVAFLIALTNYMKYRREGK